MEVGELRCRCYPKLVAVERHHPRGPIFETGTGLKAHHWFIIPLSKRAHDEYHRDAEAWEAEFGAHAEILLAFWKDIGFVPGAFMDVGMAPRRADWLRRVLGRLKIKLDPRPSEHLVSADLGN